jgi:hypothetical protein
MQTTEHPYVCGAGHVRAVWTRPDTAADRATWTRWCKRTAGMLAATAAVTVLIAAGIPARPLQATLEMEQLAARLERVRAIHPDTAGTIATLIDRPGYDCNRVACDARLHDRNDAARARLKGLIASSQRGIQTAGAVAARVIGTPEGTRQATATGFGDSR